MSQNETRKTSEEPYLTRLFVFWGAKWSDDLKKNIKRISKGYTDVLW